MANAKRGKAAKQTAGSGAATGTKNESQPRYESNGKHGEPWQRGKKGSLCTKLEREMADALLAASVLYEGRRYATAEGKAYCADQHGENLWHGWPIGWKEVKEPLRRQFQASGAVKRRDFQRYWDGH